ncbi:MAG: hypothetical protein ACRD3W_23160 [Terriglobales bacterium]
MPFKDAAQLVAEVTFHFEHQADNTSLRVVSPIGEQFFCERIYAPARLATPIVPKIAIPVNKPRSGTMSHCGFGDGSGRRG